jgi:hypothetical protein
MLKKSSILKSSKFYKAQVEKVQEKNPIARKEPRKTAKPEKNMINGQRMQRPEENLKESREENPQTNQQQPARKTRKITNWS